VFHPLDFIARLAALVPRPRAHQLTYHGVLAPAAEWRDLIVPAGERSIRKEPSQLLAAKALRPSRSKWAELLQRVFEIDALRCPYCGGKRKLIALLTDGQVVRKILAHLGLDTEPPRLAPAGRRPSSTSPADVTKQIGCSASPTGCGSGQALPAGRKTRRGHLDKAPKTKSKPPEASISTSSPRQRPPENAAQACRAACPCAWMS